MVYRKDENYRDLAMAQDQNAELVRFKFKQSRNTQN